MCILCSIPRFQLVAGLLILSGLFSLALLMTVSPVLMLESVGVMTVGGGVAGDWANTHQLDNLGEK